MLNYSHFHVFFFKPFKKRFHVFQATVQIKTRKSSQIEPCCSFRRGPSQRANVISFYYRGCQYGGGSARLMKNSRRETLHGCFYYHTKVALFFVLFFHSRYECCTYRWIFQPTWDFPFFLLSRQHVMRKCKNDEHKIKSSYEHTRFDTVYWVASWGVIETNDCLVLLIF